MKKFLLAYLLVVSIACWAQASSSSNSTQSSAGTGATAADTQQHTMTGCIVAHNGEFLLRTKEHHKPIELLSPNDLTTHNGHEVTVTGTWANKSTVAEHEKQEEQNQSSAEKNAHAQKEGNERHFQVTKLEMVADHCPMTAKTTSSAPSSSTTAPK